LYYVSDLFFVVRDETCHDVATSINGFIFVLIDVGHHLEVGRVSRSGHASLGARTCCAAAMSCRVILTSTG